VPNLKSTPEDRRTQDVEITVKISVPLEHFSDFVKDWEDIVQNIIGEAEVTEAFAIVPAGRVELATY
jgi:hypothetical protein